MSANLKNSAVTPRMEKASFCLNPKEGQCQRIYKLPYKLCLFCMLVRLYSKSFKLGFSSTCHEIKRLLILGRKVRTNLDSILKSRDIILPRKVRVVKAMIFPVVMYGCESWTVKKAEHRRTDALNCGVGEDS